MGCTINTNKYRYTEWGMFDRHAYKRVGYGSSKAELYDHTIDPQDNVNRVKHPDYAKIKTELEKMLHDGWRNALPPGCWDILVCNGKTVDRAAEMVWTIRCLCSMVRYMYRETYFSIITTMEDEPQALYNQVSLGKFYVILSICIYNYCSDSLRDYFAGGNGTLKLKLLESMFFV